MTDAVNVPRGDCPFCGGDTEVRAWDSDGWMAYKCCDGCDMRGPASAFKYDDVEEAKADAVSRWNSAALAAAPKAEPDVCPRPLYDWMVERGIWPDDGPAEWSDVIQALNDHENELARPEAPKVEQEPVAWRWQTPISHVGDGTRWGWTFASHTSTPPASINAEPLYTHPAPASDELSKAASLVSRLLANSIAHYGNPKDEDFGVGATHKEARDFLTKHKGPQS